MKITNDLLKQRFDLDTDIKAKTKELDKVNDLIKSFMLNNSKNSVVTTGFIAQLIEQNRTVYNVPSEIKSKYAEIKAYQILKVNPK